MFRGQERCIQSLVGKPQGKRAFGRPMHRWRDHIKTDLQEVVGGVKDRIKLAQDREVAGSCKRGNEPSGSIKWGSFLTS